MIDELRVERVRRRAFLKTIARAAIAACVSGAGFFLVQKGRIAYREGWMCGNREPCEGCSQLEDCVLPQALLTRISSTHSENTRFTFPRFSGDGVGYIRTPTKPGRNEAIHE